MADQSPHNTNGVNGHGINGHDHDGDEEPVVHRNSVSGLRPIMQPGEQNQRHPTQAILAGINPNLPPEPMMFAMDGDDGHVLQEIESIEGSGHGSPLQTALGASPIPGTEPRTLPPRGNVTTANLHALENIDNISAAPSSSHMAEIPLRSRPRPIRRISDSLPARDSYIDFNNELPSPALHHRSELNTPILIDYSALIVPKDAPPTNTLQQLSMNPMCLVVLDVGPGHNLATILSNIGDEVLKQDLKVNERELVVKRGQHMRLLAVWAQDKRVGSSIVVDDATLSRCLSMMARRGWKDYFAIKVSECQKKGDHEAKENSTVVAEGSGGSEVKVKGKGPEIPQSTSTDRYELLPATS